MLPDGGGEEEVSERSTPRAERRRPGAGPSHPPCSLQVAGTKGPGSPGSGKTG